MTIYSLYQKCSYCNGVGKTQRNIGSGDNPILIDINCPICFTTGKLLWGEHEQSFADTVDSILDKCTDILDKCNDIFEKLNE